MSKLILGPIVGGLSHDSAYLWGRASGDGTLHAWYGEKPDLSDAKYIKSTIPLADISGYAGVVPISGLKPDTLYHYALSLNDSLPDKDSQYRGSFTTSPKDGQPKSFSFVFGSCFLPKGRNPGAIFYQIEAMRSKSEACKRHALRFILMLGDQIYADKFKHSFWKRVSTSEDDYRNVYHHTWSNAYFQNLLRNIPAYMILDDHEVDDDWSWTDKSRQYAQIPPWRRWGRRLRFRPEEEWAITRQRVKRALQTYWEHQGMHTRGWIETPKLTEKGHYDLDETGSLAYNFNYGGAAFFVLDTRTMRVKKGNKGISILDKNQVEALEKWLVDCKDTYPVKFIVTSCALLYRARFDIPNDRWAGFTSQREELLGLIAKHQVEGVYFLAGDLHSAHAVRADIHDAAGFETPIWEFCASPFEQKSNWTAAIPGMYHPFESAHLKNQQCLFTYPQHNYGVVRVDYANQDEARVRFEVWGKQGDKPKKEIKC